MGKAKYAKNNLGWSVRIISLLRNTLWEINNVVIVQKMSENAGVIGCQIHAKKFGSNPIPGTLH